MNFPTLNWCDPKVKILFQIILVQKVNCHEKNLPNFVIRFPKFQILKTPSFSSIKDLYINFSKDNKVFFKYLF